MKQSKRRAAPLPKRESVRPKSFPERHSHLLAALALIALAFLAFANSFDGGFVLDNRALILNDPRLREATASNLGLILRHTYWWPTGEGGVYRPFTTLSYLFNYAILDNGSQPGGYHWVNSILHAVNALLAYALAIRFLRKLWPAFFAAALWAVHPVQTEAVTNIVGRADLLAATGLLGGFLAYVRSRETTGWQRWVWLIGIAAFMAVGVFSKENAVVLPGVIVLYELVFRKERRETARNLTGLAATLPALALMFWQRSVVLTASLPKEVPFTDNPILGAGFLAGRWTAIKVLARYLWLTVWPARLSSDYSWSEISIAHGSPADWIGLIVILALIAALVLLYRRNRRLFFLAGMSLAWMAPVSNVLFPIGTIMAERFLYVPLLAVTACAAAGIYAASEKLRSASYVPAAVCLLITAALAARTWARNADWRDDLAMANASVASAPGSFKTHDLLANVLFASDPTHANIDRVIEESEKSRAILDPLPDDRNIPDPYQFAGTCYMYRRDYPKAIAALKRFLAIEKTEFADFKRNLKPGGPSAKTAEGITAGRQGDAYTILSMAYLRSEDTAKAAAAAKQAQALNPLSPQLYRQISEIDLASGKTDDAAIALIEGAFVTSDGSLRQDLLRLYHNGGPTSCALTQGPRGLALNPGCPLVHSHLCGAAGPAIRTLTKAGQVEQARAREKMFAEEFGCPREQ
jgi:tetratricopeptide (TPR) repeat protein